MSDTKRQPSAQVTLTLGKTYRSRGFTFINGRAKTVVGESNISFFETDSRFVVRRDKVVREEAMAARKSRKVKPTKKKKSLSGKKSADANNESGDD